MLAQNFKSAADLGLDELEKEALVKTLVLFETGKMIHTRNYYYVAESYHKFTGHFNMMEWRCPTKCGTVACIGGTAELVGNLPTNQFGNRTETNAQLRELFCPCPPRIIGWERITTAQAAVALRSYLTTGDARWDLAL